MEHKLIFKSGNVDISTCKVWWDNNPLQTPIDGQEVLRDEGERFSISLVKDGYKSKIAFETNSLDQDAVISADLEKIREEEYIYVTPFIHACQSYKMGKPSEPVLWQKVDENTIEVVPNLNYIGRGKVSYCFQILVDSSSKLTTKTTNGVKVYLTNYNHFREFNIKLDEAEEYPKVLGEVLLSNEEGKTFHIILVSKLTDFA